MEIIRIKKSTIRKNPDYGMGGMVRMYPGARDVRVEHIGDLPKKILDKCVVISTQAPFNEPIVRELSVVADHERVIKYFTKTGRSSVTIETNMIEYTCKDHGSEYLFKYENPLVTCSECGKKVRFNDIESGYTFDEDGEEYNADKCPNCGERNPFNYKFQSIEDAIKNN